MSFHAVVPAPRTMVRGVRKLPPATLMRIEPDGRARRASATGACSFGPRRRARL
jgi:asparagine synthase (glutamine-hydrolysing)